MVAGLDTRFSSGNERFKFLAVPNLKKTSFFRSYIHKIVHLYEKSMDAVMRNGRRCLLMMDMG